VSVIFSGDFFQFPPVGGSALYTPISSYAGQNDSEIQKRLGRLAWKSLNAVVNLTEQQRMKEDPAYAESVNRLRVRQCTPDDVDLFNSRLIRSANHPEGVDMGDEENWEAAAIVTTNALREILNAHKADIACADSQTLVVCGALDKASRELTYSERSDLLRLNVTALKSSSSLPGHIPLYEGMPVILRSRNLSTDLGITNGAQGVVRKIFTEVCPVGLIYATCVLVEFAHSKVQLTDLPLGYYPIVPSTWAFTTVLHDHGGQPEKIRITRHQLPIQPAFAITGHSAQGKTLPRVLVNLHEGGFAAYVAASRARGRSGLCITQPVTLAQLNKRIPHDLAFECRRFEALEHNTLVRVGVKKGIAVEIPDAEGERTLAKMPVTIEFDTNEDRKHQSKRSRTAEDQERNDTAEGSVPPLKRKRVRTIQPGDVFHLPMEIVRPLSATSGCMWSVQNWSCAYDSVFMVLFYAYREADEQWRLSWSTCNQLTGILAASFSHLSQSVTNLHSQHLFDHFRDQFRQHLSDHDPVAFPHLGAALTSVTAILDYLMTNVEPMLWKRNTMAPGAFPRDAERLTFSLPSYCSRLHWTGSHQTPLSLQQWCDLWLEKQVARLQAPATSSATPSMSSMPSIDLGSPPPLLFFEIGRMEVSTILPVKTLHLPCAYGNAEYNLRGILYLGAQHFVARLVTDACTWVYDGRADGGCPQAPDSEPFIIEDPQELTRLRGHDALVYVYVLGLGPCHSSR
jgi:hypothetical protein